MKRIVWITLSLSVALLAACSQHDDNVPPQLPISEPPQPVNFVVSTADSINFDLSWEVDDPSIVDYYFVYSEILWPIPSLEVDTTSSTSVKVNTGIQLPVRFCVSSVTFQNVESRLTCRIPVDYD